MTDFPSRAFDEWWQIYPHRIGKLAAEKSFERIRKAGNVSFQTLVDGVRNYVRDKPPTRPWCNPATWLNQGRWDDEPALPVGTIGWGETLQGMIDDENREAEMGGTPGFLITDQTAKWH